MNERTNLSVMEPRDKPDVELMIREIADAINGANALGIFKKLEVCHHTRKCWWVAQQDDGRKPAPRKGGKENLYWWEGSPETRYHKADEIVLERAGIRELVLHRGEVTISPSMQCPFANGANAFNELSALRELADDELLIERINGDPLHKPCSAAIGYRVNGVVECKVCPALGE